jgi:hypothetical protein
VHRYAPTSPSAFNHKKKPLLPGCDRRPSRSLARGAQQQPSPPHSGRGHSTAYTHRHFPLPSLVQDCSDGPLALAQAPNPHMPQYVSLTWPWNESIQAPSACCSLEASYHLPLHLSPSDGLHIEVALASANTKIVACRRYIMYQLLRGVSTKKTCE